VAPRFNKGFTLLEVLITVAILSTAIVFIFRSFIASLSASRLAQEISLACFLAEDKIWEIEANYPQALPQNPEREIIQGINFGHRYEILNSDYPGLKELKSSVFWREGKKDNTLEFFTYLPANKR